MLASVLHDASNEHSAKAKKAKKHTLPGLPQPSGGSGYYIDASTTPHAAAVATSCLAELLSLSTQPPHHMPQTRSQTKADKVDQRVDAVAYYLAVAVPIIFLYTVAQNLGYA